MSNGPTFEDAFNLLCGDLIGRGIHREVFECRIRPDLVVKVEKDADRRFANVLEMHIWSDFHLYEPVAKWLAPCDYLSYDGRILLQRRVRPLHTNDKLPDKLPAFLSDIKRANFGTLDNRLVCVDYALAITRFVTRERAVKWD